MTDEKREGDVGTWSHCGSSKPHAPHLHTIVFNEGPYPDVECNGTPGPAQKVAMVHREVKRMLVDPEDIPAFEAGGWRTEETDLYEYGWAADAQSQSWYATREEAEEFIGQPRRFRRLKAGPWHEYPGEEAQPYSR